MLTLSFAISLPPNDRSDTRSPAAQRGALLCGKVVPLVYADNPGEAAAHVIENLFDDRKVDANLCHSARGGSPQVVERPMLDRLPAVLFGDAFVEALLGLCEAAWRPLSGAKQEWRVGETPLGAQNLDGQRGQRDRVLAPILAPNRW